jgi:hypothetical protein
VEACRTFGTLLTPRWQAGYEVFSLEKLLGVLRAWDLGRREALLEVTRELQRLFGEYQAQKLRHFPDER